MLVWHLCGDATNFAQGYKMLQLTFCTSYKFMK